MSVVSAQPGRQHTGINWAHYNLENPSVYSIVKVDFLLLLTASFVNFLKKSGHMQFCKVDLHTMTVMMADELHLGAV